MTSLLTRLPRTTFELIASFLSLEAKESLARLCSALHHPLSLSCYHSDAIDLDLDPSGRAHPELDAVQRRRRVDRLVVLLPHVASIRLSDGLHDLPPGLQEGVVAAVKGKWLTELRMTECRHMRLLELSAAVFGAVAEREGDSPLSSLQWTPSGPSIDVEYSFSQLCRALLRCTRLTSLDLRYWQDTPTQWQGLLLSLPSSLTHFHIHNPQGKFRHEQLLVDAFRSPAFLPSLAAVQSWQGRNFYLWDPKALAVIAGCPINEAGDRRPIQHARLCVSPDMLPSLAELRQVTTLEMGLLRDDVDWMASAAAFPSFLPHLHTVRLESPTTVRMTQANPNVLQSLLHFLSTRPMREFMLDCSASNARRRPFTPPEWAAFAAMRSILHLALVGSNPHSASSKGLTTSAADLSLLPAGAWPALLRLDLTKIALTSAELTALVSAAPNLQSFKLSVVPACSAVCLPIIEQHCAELRELQLACGYWRKRVGMDELSGVLDAHPPSSAALLPRLQQLSLFLSDDSAVPLLLHRLLASPLQWIDVTTPGHHKTLWANPFLIPVLSRCPHLPAITFSGPRCSGPLFDVLTQRDDTTPTGFRFLQRLQPLFNKQSRVERVEAVFCDNYDRAALITALQECLRVEEREVLERWSRQEVAQGEARKEMRSSRDEVSAAQLPEEILDGWDGTAGL